MTTLLEKAEGEIPGEEIYIFYCPGCECCHYVRTKRAPGRDQDPLWTLSGDLEKPTAFPSVLIPMENRRCHLFIKDGNLVFLEDCYHALKSKTVPMEPV